MKIKESILFGVTILSMGIIAFISNILSASAHTWWMAHLLIYVVIGWPGMSTLNIWVLATMLLSKQRHIKLNLPTQHHRTLPCTKHIGKKTGAHSYTFHGSWYRDGGFDQRITIKKLSSHRLRAYFDGHSITRGSVYPNSFFKR